MLNKRLDIDSNITLLYELKYEVLENKVIKP